MRSLLFVALGPILAVFSLLHAAAAAPVPTAAATSGSAAAPARGGVALSLGAAGATAKVKKNVLLLICDDLRTQLKVYGHADYMRTPHIDAFAADAVVFDRAFTNYPYCAPSRNSFM
jgi:hypothetical protein